TDSLSPPLSYWCKQVRPIRLYCGPPAPAVRTVCLRRALPAMTDSQPSKLRLLTVGVHQDRPPSSTSSTFVHLCPDHPRSTSIHHYVAFSSAPPSPGPGTGWGASPSRRSADGVRSMNNVSPRL